jgi:N-acyl-L-homoserine lactone synthetase
MISRQGQGETSYAWYIYSSPDQRPKEEDKYDTDDPRYLLSKTVLSGYLRRF